MTKKSKQPDSNQKFPLMADREISSSRDDILNRAAFVERLARTVIASSKRETGTVIGVVGPWGTGKSSILNLLSEEISEIDDNAIVVRFVPWLFGGTEDLVRAFFRELVGAISENTSAEPRAVKVINQLADYGGKLSPFADLLLPGAGGMAKAGLDALKTGTSKHLASKSTLDAARRDLIEAIRNLDKPIVVLIDEIDRLEDSEIRTIARLVRSVADFPSISYVLAFDAVRVAEALGNGYDNKSTERGRAYLEKIVAFQAHVPVSLPSKVEELLCCMLDELHISTGVIPKDWRLTKDVNDLFKICIPRAISTLRDTKRIHNTFSHYIEFLADEIDWIDLLAFSILEIKAPDVTAAIRENPYHFTSDTNDYIESIARMRRNLDRNSNNDSPEGFEGLDENAREKIEAKTYVRELIMFLFPQFADEMFRRQVDVDSISTEQSLMTVLFLDLLPGAVSKKEVTALVGLGSNKIASELKKRKSTRGAQKMVARMATVYSKIGEKDDLEIWSGVAEASESDGDHFLDSLRSADTLAQEAAEQFRYLRKSGELPKDIAANILRKQIESGWLNFSSHALRQQIFELGLFDQRIQDSQLAYLGAEEAADTIGAQSEDARTMLLSGKIWLRIVDLCTFYNMIDAGIWNSDCKDAVMSEINSKDNRFDNFVYHQFGENFTADHSHIGKYFFDLETLMTRIKRRLAEDDFSETETELKKAFEKSVRHSG